jgi:RNA polymerase sigma-70 factor (ECF subfamily)
MDPDLRDAIGRVLADPGDQAAVGEMDRALRPRLKAYFARGPWPAHDADDLVQKTLSLVFSRMGTLEHPDRFLGWLFAIARNVHLTAAADWTGTRRREVTVDAIPRAAARIDGPDALELAIDDERRDAVESAIRRLPDRQRQCLRLRLREELSYDEIAELLRLSPLTVRNHIAQAKEALRRALVVDEEAER